LFFETDTSLFVAKGMSKYIGKIFITVHSRTYVDLFILETR